MKAGGGRFSPFDYSARLKVGGAESKEEESIAGELSASSHVADFERLADEMKAFLAAPRGLNDEERRGYNETLNRAVLGFIPEREQIYAVINDRLRRLRIHNEDGYHHPYQSLAEALFAEVIGLNVLELVLQHKDGLEEVQVVGTQIFEVRGGEVVMSQHQFASVRDVERIQSNLVLYNNDRFTPRKRWAEVMLSDGSRVTMTGFGFTSKPTLTIRFFTFKSFGLPVLCEPEYGTISSEMLSMLQAVLQARFNLIIIGPTNSGKTHLMKALIASVPDEERIITIEGRFEMMLGRDFPAKNIVEYEADEDDPQHQANRAFKLALRQSPQRIVHAEIRDSDANIYVRACTRGHSGSMTTVHANALEDVPETITDMCMLDGRGMNPERMTKRIAEYVVEIGIEMRNIKGRRVVTRLAEMDWVDNEVKVRDWAVYDELLEQWQYPQRPSPKAIRKLGRGGLLFE